MQKVEVFKRLPATAIGMLIAAMKAETYSPRDVILKRGSEVNEIFFISSGTVAVLNKDDVELCHLEDGDGFGTACLILKGQIYTAVAVETTEVFSISKKKFLEFLAPYPEVSNLFFNTVKAQIATLKDLEGKISTGVDLLSDLRSGLVLENRTRRLVAK